MKHETLHALICHIHNMMMVPFLVVSHLQYRTHELLCFTRMEHKERLCQQGVLLRHKHTPVPQMKIVKLTSVDLPVPCLPAE